MPSSNLMRATGSQPAPSIDEPNHPPGRRPGPGGVLVIGAGVSGLTSALCLRRRGFEVTVIADRFAPQVTSVVAGALWEWPPAVCGHHHDEVALQARQGLVRDVLRDLRPSSPPTRRRASSSGP